jgi:methyl-accepting chemotaxis protein
MLKIRTKLIVTMVVLTLIIFFMGIYSYANNLGTHKSYKALLDVQDLRFHVKSIQFRLAGLSNDERGYLLNGDQSIAESSQQSSAAIEKTAATTQSLVKMAEKLTDSVTSFKLS